MENVLDPASVIFLVFSEDYHAIEPLFANCHIRNSAFRYVMIDEDFATSLALMTLCDHHFVSDSTFSFWGLCCLLDEQQQYFRGVSGTEATWWTDVCDADMGATPRGAIASFFSIDGRFIFP
jgi:hypothetical protein